MTATNGSTLTNTSPTPISTLRILNPVKDLSTTIAQNEPLTGLNSQEIRFIEHARVLRQQDPAFEYLLTALNDCMAIMQERGGDYNGEMSGVEDQIYEFGDVEAYIHTKRPIRRLKQILSSNGLFFSDAKVKDKIIDAINYALMWLCCREMRKYGHAQDR